MRRSRSLPAMVAIAFASILASTANAGPTADTNIGVTASVKDEVLGIRVTQQDVLHVGSGIYHDEVVKTNASSIAQLRFLDKTSLSVGPNSQVTLDKFVYDPSTNVGNVVLQASRGTFRFITGSQDPRNYSIKTPVATIGVRGTIIHVLYDANGVTVVLEDGNAIVTTTNGQTINLGTIGTGITINGGGVPGGIQPFSGPTVDPFGVGWKGFYLSSLKTALQTAVDQLNQQQFANDADKNAAYVNSLALIIGDSVLGDGDTLSADLTSLIIAYLQQLGVPDSVIGAALADAALGLPGKHFRGAKDIAKTTNNEGTNLIILAFIRRLKGDTKCLQVIAAEGNQCIGLLGELQENPESTGETPPPPGNTPPPFIQPPPPCNNPSCT